MVIHLRGGWTRWWWWRWEAYHGAAGFVQGYIKRHLVGIGAHAVGYVCHGGMFEATVGLCLKCKVDETRDVGTSNMEVFPACMWW